MNSSQSRDGNESDTCLSIKRVWGKWNLVSLILISSKIGLFMGDISGDRKTQVRERITFSALENCSSVVN